MNKWILPFSLFVLVCIGCKKSNSPVASSGIPDFTQMTFADVKASAEKGNRLAQWELGMRFKYGIGIPTNSEMAVEWWRRSAMQQFVPAEYRLGLAYIRGSGVPKDENEGLKWVRLAAEADFPEAQDLMGYFYFRGTTNITPNQLEAFRWFKAAADKDFDSAQYHLALCFLHGRGTPTNTTDAVIWLQRAASNGLDNAQVELGDYYQHTALRELGVLTSAPLTEEQRNNPNFFQAVYWFRKAANQGDPEGQVAVAIECATGCGVEKDRVESYKWLALANEKKMPGDLVAKLLERFAFTPEQISAGKLRAEEFSKTNHVTPKTVREIPGL